MNLVRALLIREIQLLRSYAFNTVSGIITVVIIFLILLLGVRYALPVSGAMGNTEEAMVVAFFLWSWLLGGLNTLTWGITMEAQQGTLEQLYMSPYGFRMVSILMLGISIISNLAFSLPLLVILMLISGRFLHIDVATVSVLLFFMVLPAYGLGYVFGGMALLYKRIQNVFQVINMGVVGLFMLPDSFPWNLIPFTSGYHLISRAMRQGIGLTHLPPVELSIFIATSILFFLGGLWIYGLLEKRVKRLGVLGYY